MLLFSSTSARAQEPCSLTATQLSGCLYAVYFNGNVGVTTSCSINLGNGVSTGIGAYGQPTPAVPGMNYGGGTYTYPANGTYTITGTIYNASGGVMQTCTTTIVVSCGVPPTPTCNFNAVFRIDCSRLTVDFTPLGISATQGTNFSYVINAPNNLHTVPISGNPPPFSSAPSAHSLIIHDINTSATPSLTITMQVTLPTGPCSITRTFQIRDVANAQIRGIFIGKQCEVADLSRYQITNFLNPTLPFIGSLTDESKWLYVAGVLNVNISKIFVSTRMLMGLSSGINVGGAEMGNPITLGLTNGTNIQPQGNCACLWRGINVSRGGQLQINRNQSTAAQDVTIAEAMYGVRSIADPNFEANAPQLSIERVRFERNFIGLRLSDGEFALTRLRNTRFSGGVIGGTRCWVCPMIANDLQDSDGPINAFPDRVFLGSFSPTHQVGGGQVNIPNPEQDFDFVENRSYAGIFIDGDRPEGFGFDGAMLPVLTPENAGNLSFENLASGIVANDTDVRIRGTGSFTTMTDGDYANSSGNGIVFLSGSGNNNLEIVGLTSTEPNGPGFRNCVTGVEIVPYGVGVGEVAVRRSTMADMQRGINQKNSIEHGFVGSFLNVAFIGNTITSDRWLTSSVWQNRNEIFGIYIVDNERNHTQYSVFGNTITINAPLFPPLGAPAGVLARTNPGVGIHAEGLFGERGCNTDPLSASNCDAFSVNNIFLRNGFIGMHFVNTDDTRIFKNNVLLEESDISTTAFDKMIAIEGGSRSFTAENALATENDFSDFKKNFSTGIHVTNHVDGVYCSNEVTQLNDGLSFHMENGFNSDIKQNKLYSPMRNGVIYGATYNNGSYTTAETGAQKEKGNEWFYDNFKNQKAFSFDIPSGSRWTVPNDATEQDPFPFVSPLFWFDFNGNHVDPQPCDGMVPPDLKIVTPRDLDIASASYPVSPLQYFSSWVLYQRLLDAPELLDDSSLASFKQNADAGTLGRLFNIRFGLKALKEMPGNQRIALSDLDLAKRVIVAEIDSLLKDLDAEPDNQIIVDALKSKYQALLVLTGQMNDISISHIQVVQNKVNLLLSELINIVPDGVAEEQLKWLYQIHANTLATSVQLSSADLDLLKKLATACPQYMGPAVYDAAILYDDITGEATQRPLCSQTIDFQQSQQDRSLKISSAQTFAVSPNPNTQSTLLQWTGVATQIRILDMMGREKLQVKVAEGQQSLILDTNTFQVGLYQASITFQDGSTAQQAVVKH
jgi:hypothetical protein